MRASHTFPVVLIAVFAAPLVACGSGADATDEGVERSGSCTRELALLYGDEGLFRVADVPEIPGSRYEIALFVVGDRASDQPISTALELCPEDAPTFDDEFALARCSGVRLMDSLVVTAAHCLPNASCGDVRVTGAYDAPGGWEDDVGCSEVLFHDTGSDLAVFRTDSDPTPGLPAVRVAAVESAVEATLVSHPLGASTRVDPDAEMRRASNGALWARADAFSGSSGAGLFSTDGVLLGVLTSGLQDFTQDGRCRRLARSDSDGFERVADLVAVLPEVCRAARVEDCPPDWLAPPPIAPRQVDPPQPDGDRTDRCSSAD